jgi:hypothetical protein
MDSGGLALDTLMSGIMCNELYECMFFGHGNGYICGLSHRLTVKVILWLRLQLRLH